MATLGDMTAFEEQNGVDLKLVDKAGMLVLRNVSRYLDALVELQDAHRFSVFQGCLGDLLKEAAERANNGE